MLFAVSFVLGYHLVFLERYAAKTAIHLWHDLHKCKGMGHDFSPLLAPNVKGIFIGVVRHDEIKAIANCERYNLQTLRAKTLAHPPEEYEGACQLLRLLHERHALVDLNTIWRQPRWYMEELYRLKDTMKDV